MNLIAVVLSWNALEDTLACLESLRGVPAICVDNGSADGTVAAVRERFPEVEVVATGVNLGFSGGNNVGIRRALERGAEWVLLLNNDATMDAGLPAALARAAAARPDAGVLACKVFFADRPDRIWYAGGRVGLLLGYHGRSRGYGEPDGGRWVHLEDVDRATGAAMAVSRAALDEAGLLDEHLFAYVEDVDWCLRIRAAGHAVVFVPDAIAWHRVSASTGGAASTANLYYDTRNTIVVCERHRPLPPLLRGLRRAAIVAAHLAQAAWHPFRTKAAAAVVRGWRDARRGRLGRMP
ncbi:MAG TPA: glycosyltransferase family 2 protein [Gaiellaceae bacterium]|nr:glycosyltransferase family 2 protein [Gaiellaceae bacterium]